MTPVSVFKNVVLTSDLYGKSFRSVTGKASISALKATTFPGLSPFNNATTPVFAIPVSTSRPIDFKCCAIFSAVLNS